MTAVGTSFSATQTLALRAVFGSADRNTDQLISKNEAELVRKKLSAATPLSGSSLSTAFSRLDVNKDNRLSAAELAVLLEQQSAPSDPAPPQPPPSKPSAPETSDGVTASALERFEAVVAGAKDKDGDGVFTKTELEVGRKGLSKAFSFSGSALADAFDAADANGDKKLSLAEITVFLASEPVPAGSKPPVTGGGDAVSETPRPIEGGGAAVTPPKGDAGAEGGEIPDPFPVTGPYKTDKLGAINVFGMAGEPQSAERPYSLNYAEGILRVEAREGDRRQKSSEVNRAIERSEVSFQGNPFQFGQDYQISFEMMFEGSEESTADNDKFFQIHNVNDPGDSSLGPIFAMQLEGDRMRIVTRSDPNAQTTSRVKDNWIFEDSADIQRNHWYKFDISLRVDPFGNGKVIVSRDGQEVANYNGAIGYNDAKPPYAKVGVYRDTSEETQVRLYKDLSFKKISP